MTAIEKMASRPLWRWPLCWLGMCGGRIERDHLDRINWRCGTCGDWSNDPVSKEAEKRAIDTALSEGERG